MTIIPEIYQQSAFLQSIPVNCIQSRYLFHCHHPNKLHGMAVIHLDYFIHTRTKLFGENVLEKLHQLFEIGKTAAGSFKYIDLNVLDDGSEIEICLKDYAESIDFVIS